MKQKYIDSKVKSEKWLKEMEIKVHNFEPLAIDIEVIEGQYNELESLLELYKVDGKTLMEKFNDYGVKYLTYLSKQQNIMQPFNLQKQNQQFDETLNRNIEIESEIKKF
jgi:hypothetical protein